MQERADFAAEMGSIMMSPFKLLVEALGMCARVAAYKVATKVLNRLPVEPLWRLGVLGKILGKKSTEVRLHKEITKP